MGRGPRCPQCMHAMAQAKGGKGLCYPCEAGEQQRERRDLAVQARLKPVIVPGARPLGASFLARGDQLSV